MRHFAYTALPSSGQAKRIQNEFDAFGPGDLVTDGFGKDRLSRTDITG